MVQCLFDSGLLTWSVSLNYSQSINIGPSEGGTIVPSTYPPNIHIILKIVGFWVSNDLRQRTWLALILLNQDSFLASFDQYFPSMRVSVKRQHLRRNVIMPVAKSQETRCLVSLPARPTRLSHHHCETPYACLLAWLTVFTSNQQPFFFIPHWSNEIEGSKIIIEFENVCAWFLFKLNRLPSYSLNIAWAQVKLT